MNLKLSLELLINQINLVQESESQDQSKIFISSTIIKVQTVEGMIRVEREEDYREVQRITRQAFWNLYTLGCDEHLVAHKLRKTQDFIKELSLVVEEDNRIIAHIIYTKSKIHYPTKILETITFGPLTVDPSKQNKGIGSFLVKASLQKAKQLGYRAVVIGGFPLYYARFGFKCCKEFNVKDELGNFPLGLQILELEPGYLPKDQDQGIIIMSEGFNYQPQQLQEFQKQFPQKEKFKTKSQQAFAIASHKLYGEPLQVTIKDIANRQKIQ